MNKDEDKEWSQGEDEEITWLLVNRNEFLSKHWFWPIHLCWMWPATDPDMEAPFEDAFEDSIEEGDKLLITAIDSEELWPYFPIKLPNNYSASVQYSNYPEDYNIEYYIGH